MALPIDGSGANSPEVFRTCAIGSSQHKRPACDRAFVAGAVTGVFRPSTVGAGVLRHTVVAATSRASAGLAVISDFVFGYPSPRPSSVPARGGLQIP